MRGAGALETGVATIGQASTIEAMAVASSTGPENMKGGAVMRLPAILLLERALGKRPALESAQVLDQRTRQMLTQSRKENATAARLNLAGGLTPTDTAEISHPSANEALPDTARISDLSANAVKQSTAETSLLFANEALPDAAQTSPLSANEAPLGTLETSHLFRDEAPPSTAETSLLSVNEAQPGIAETGLRSQSEDLSLLRDRRTPLLHRDVNSESEKTASAMDLPRGSLAIGIRRRKPSRKRSTHQRLARTKIRSCLESSLGRATKGLALIRTSARMSLLYGSRKCAETSAKGKRRRKTRICCTRRQLPYPRTTRLCSR